MTSSKEPTSEEVARAVALLSQPAHQRQFFDRLENPHWVKPLGDKGLFNVPPPLIRDQARRTTLARPWPQSRYLARMAAEAPRIVMDQILKIPATDNVRILEDFVEAALAMPGDIAARIVPLAQGWARNSQFPFFPRKLGDLAEHLARNNESKAALLLARDLLAVQPGKRPPYVAEPPGTLFRTAPPTARIDRSEYEEILKKNVPILVHRAGYPAFQMLCDLLDLALAVSKSNREERSPEDLSHIWRPAVEDHSQNHNGDVRSHLVEAIRDSAEILANRDSAVTSTIISAYRRRRSRIFLRLAHHLLRTHPKAVPALVKNAILNRGLFAKSHLWHEYSLLLRAAFGHISPDAQKTVLSWIEVGPHLARFGKWHQAFFGRPPSESEIGLHTMAWQRNHFALISDDLSEAGKAQYLALIEKVGPPYFPEFGSYSTGGAWGHRSPKGQDELGELSLEELLRFLNQWEPPPDPMGHSIAGLADQLTFLVARDPVRFAAEAAHFQVVDRVYVEAMLAGLYQAAKKQVKFPWASALTLCDWVLRQTGSVPEQEGPSRKRHRDWRSARIAIARLVTAGIESDPPLIPMDLQPNVWALLEVLIEDPIPNGEEADRGDQLDLLTLSLNTTRGEALNGVVRYALWRRRDIDKQTDSGPVGQQLGFDAMPEVRRALDKHLEPEHDPSLIIRTVYGRWFPWLVLLDENWATSNVANIFPASEALRKLRASAWDAYILTCRPYDNVFEVLRSEYNREIANLAAIPSVDTERSHLGDASEHLAQHLMAFYWRGKLSLGPADGYLQRFFTTARDELRSRAITFLGRSQRDLKEPIAEDLADRLRTLWVSRLDAARAATDLDSHAKEIAAFGWWYAAARFDDEWSTRQLLEGLEITNRLEVDYLVIQRLVGMAETMPALALECLKLMINGDKEGFAIAGWHTQVRAILGIALKHRDPETKQSAIALADRLGKTGQFDFTDFVELGLIT